jgi:hypothetical protein
MRTKPTWDARAAMQPPAARRPASIVMRVTSDWTCRKQRRRAQREREFALAIAETNAFRFSKIYGAIHSDDLHRTALPSAKNCVLFLWATSSTLPDVPAHAVP